MKLVTSFNNDFFYFDPFSSAITQWEDAGGTDVLMMSMSPQLPGQVPGLAIVNTTTAIRVDTPDGTLTMPHGPGGAASIEFLEWRAYSYGPDQAPYVLATLQIVTDLDRLSGADLAIIGTDADEMFIAPSQARDKTGFSILFGNGGNDSITLSTSQQYIAYGGAGGDSIRALGRVDTVMNGNNGKDHLKGARGDDTIYGGLGDDRLIGGRGDDTLKGDLIFSPMGRGGNDVLRGGAGNDHLFGDQGRDRLTGGAGADIFQFTLGESSFGLDRITDFDATQDSIVLDTHTFPGRIRFKAKDGDTLLSFDGADLVVLMNVELARADIDFMTF